MEPKRFAKASDIFAAVFLDTPIEQREAEIASHCSGDPELEAEVRRLIASAETLGPLDVPLVSFHDEETPASSEAFAEGRRVGGRFRLVRLLGQGGMGQVWEAVDEQLHVPRALKTIRPEVAGDPAMIERFKREVERAQQVTHQNVCRVYDLSFEEGIPFLSMELLAGESLAERLTSQKPFTRNEVPLLLRQCAGALDAAHRAGLVHRDFKPGNVMLVPTADGRSRAVVMDFGLARPVDATGHSSPGAGTPAYMAPEQAAGGEITPAADIYAFGVVACRVMTGKRPSEGGLDLLSRRQRTVFLECLNPDPAHRPGSCTGFLDKLNRSVWSRRTLAVAAAGAAGLLYYATAGSSPAAASIAVLPFEAASEGEEVRVAAESLVDGVLNRLSRVRDLRVIPRASSGRYSVSKDRPEAFARTVHTRFLLMGTVRASPPGFRVTVRLVDTSDARTLWEQTYDRPPAELPEIERTLTSAALAQMGVSVPAPNPLAPRPNAEADRTYRLGRYHLSRRDSESLRKARQHFQVAMQLAPEWALPRVGLAQTLLTMAERQDEAPSTALPVAQEALDRALVSDPQSAEAYATLGLLSSVYHRDFAAAERSFQRAIDLEPNNTTARQWFSFTLAKERRFSEALRQSALVVELDPLSVAAYQNHTLILFCARRYPEMVVNAERLADLDPNHYLPQMLRAYAHAASGRPSLALHELANGPKTESPSTARIRLVGEVYALIGDREKATEMLDRMKQLRASGAAMPSAYIAFLHAALGQTEDAFRWLETAWAEHDTFLSLLFMYPACDSLRGDPRYRQLVARLGIRENMAQDSRPSR